MPSVHLERQSKIRPKDIFLSPFREKNQSRLWLARRSDLTRPAYRYMVSITKRPVVYVKVGKAANSTVTHILYYLETGTIHEGSLFDENDVLIQGDLKAIENAKKFKSSDLFGFSFVRHPESRTYSCFKNLFLEKRNKAAAPHLPHLNTMGFDGLTSDEAKFDCFLEYLEACIDADPMRVDFHFRPQVLSLGLPDLSYDFIGRVERFSEDMAHVLDQVGVSAEQRKAIAGLRRNASERPSAELSAAQKAKVRRLYANDYEAFGYR